jgi:hypothetical protein
MFLTLLLFPDRCPEEIFTNPPPVLNRPVRIEDDSTPSAFGVRRWAFTSHPRALSPYVGGKGWSPRLQQEAKAGAFAYSKRQRLEPSLTARGKGWSLRLQQEAKAGAFAYTAF